MTGSAPRYHGYRFPSEIISHAVWLCHRFCLSVRDVEDLLAQRGVTVTYETIRQWSQTFGLDSARRLAAAPRPDGRQLAPGRRLRAHPGTAAVFVADVDQDGDVIDILVQSRRNQRAAARCFRTLL